MVMMQSATDAGPVCATMIAWETMSERSRNLRGFAQTAKWSLKHWIFHVNVFLESMLLWMEKQKA